AEAGGAQPRGQGDLVGGEAEVAEDEVVLGEAAVEVGLEPAVALHAVGEGVADDADVVAGLQLEFGGRLRLVGGAHPALSLPGPGSVGARHQHQGGEQGGKNSVNEAAAGDKTNETHRGLPLVRCRARSWGRVLAAVQESAERSQGSYTNYTGR